jgi:acyl-CoA dehydrogenase
MMPSAYRGGPSEVLCGTVRAVDATTEPGRKSLISEVRSLARDVLVPLEKHSGRINRPLVEALASNGLLSQLFPEGKSISARDLCALREGLAIESTEAETALALQGLGGYPILQSGRPELVAEWVPAIVRGEAVAAFALTEPEAGSDAAALELRAERDGDGYRLTGSKKWISNAPDADIYVVFARTTQGAGSKGVSAFAVPHASDGFSGRSLELLALHPVGEIELDGVFVPSSSLLGELDGGFQVAMRTLDLFRPSVGAFAIGMGQAALDSAIREAFGRPLREFQAISHLLADMATRLEAARLLVYQAAEAHDTGAGDVTKLSAMAKLLATETAQFVVDSAVQIHGAAALEKGHLLEHLYREVRAPRIYEGTSQIQREVIARELYR